MPFSSKISSVFLVSLILAVVFFALPTKAAELYFESNEVVYELTEANLVTLKLNTENQLTNAVAATIYFNPELIEVTDLDLTTSIINYWV